MTEGNFASTMITAPHSQPIWIYNIEAHIEAFTAHVWGEHLGPARFGEVVLLHRFCEDIQTRCFSNFGCVHEALDPTQ